MKRAVILAAAVTGLVGFFVSQSTGAFTVSNLSPNSGPISGGTSIEFVAEIIPKFVHLEGGDGFSVGLTADGKLYSWGSNAYGQLGNGTKVNRNLPSLVTSDGALAGKNITQVSSGGFHTLAVDEAGKVYSWGIGHSGQLGNGKNGSGSEELEPVSISDSGLLADKEITKVSAGYHYSAALASDGTVFAWGRNNSGQLGDNTTTDRNVPIAVGGGGGVLAGKNVVDIFAGEQFTLALTDDGTLYSWGSNWGGQLGIGTSGAGTDQYAPVQVNSTFDGETIRHIAGGWQHAIILTAEGGAWTWGGNWSGQIGDGTNTNRSLPIRVNSFIDGGASIKSVAAGADYSMTVTNDNDIYHWGFNWDLNSSTSPQLYSQNIVEDFDRLIVGDWGHVLALSGDGMGYGWGSNWAGELGNGSNDYSLEPVPIDMSAVEPPLPEVYFGATRASLVEKISQNRYRTFAPTGSLGITDMTFSIAGEEPMIMIDAFTYTAEDTTLDTDTLGEGDASTDIYESELLAETGIDTYKLFALSFVLTVSGMVTGIYQSRLLIRSK